MPESLLGKLIKEFPEMKFNKHGLSEFGVMRSKNKSKKVYKLKLEEKILKLKL